MKWKVEIKQKLEYTETIVAEFNSAEEAVVFAETILKSCKRVCVTIGATNIEKQEEK